MKYRGILPCICYLWRFNQQFVISSYTYLTNKKKDENNSIEWTYLRCLLLSFHLITFFFLLFFLFRFLSLRLYFIFRIPSTRGTWVLGGVSIPSTFVQTHEYMILERGRIERDVKKQTTAAVIVRGYSPCII